MADELEQTCKKLDDLLQQYFTEWSNYSRLRNNLTSLIKDGFMNISKSRYSMGVGCVSELQIPDDEFLPLIEVRPFGEDENTRLEFHKYSSRPLENKSEVMKKGNGNNSERVLSTTESSVRKRRVGPGQEKANISDDVMLSKLKFADNSHEEFMVDSKTVISEISQERKDPLKWFGLLVPTSLRQGQACFQGAAETACRIANSRMLLEDIISKYMKLKEVKRLRTSKVESIQSDLLNSDN